MVAPLFAFALARLRNRYRNGGNIAIHPNENENNALEDQAGDNLVERTGSIKFSVHAENDFLFNRCIGLLKDLGGMTTWYIWIV